MNQRIHAGLQGGLHADVVWIGTCVGSAVRGEQSGDITNDFIFVLFSQSTMLRELDTYGTAPLRL